MPHIPPGTAPVARASDIPEVEPLQVPMRAMELELLAAGTRWQPDGQPGVAWLALNAAIVGTDVDLLQGRDSAVLRLACARPPETCARELVDAARGATINVRTLSEAHSAHATALEAQAPWQILDDLVAARVYEGHPYGRPLQGRSSAVQTVSTDAARGWLDRQAVRQAVIPRATDPQLAEALDAALVALNGDLPPDAAMMAPPRSDGAAVTVATYPGAQAWLAVAWALPRHATQTTSMSLSEADRGAWTLAQTCLEQRLKPWLPPRDDHARITEPGLRPQPPLVHPMAWAATGPVTPDQAASSLQSLADHLTSQPGASGPCETLPQGTLASDRVQLVVLWPQDIEFPALGDVPGFDRMIRLRAEELYR